MKMVSLFKTASIFLTVLENPRKMTENFSWSNVNGLTNTGSSNNKEKEGQHRSWEQCIFDQLCKNCDEISDHEEFDIESGLDDDDQASNSSSVYAQDGWRSVTVEEEYRLGDVKDWEGLNKMEKERKIGDSLKYVGNMKKTMSRIIVLDMLSKDVT